MNISKSPQFLITAAFVFVAGFSGSSKASLLQLSHDPLFLDQSVPPAIAVTLDDSGSMFWSFMGPSGSNGTDFTDPTLNTLYFDPSITYSPPLRADGSQMPDADPENAWVDGYPNNMNDTVDLTDDYIAIRRIVYNRFDNNVRIGFVDTQERDIGNINALYQNFHPDWEGDRAYYSVRNATDTGWDTVFLFGDDLDNFANWYSYYNSRAKLSRAAISRAFSGFGPDFKIAWQELNRLTTYSDLSKFDGNHRNDFFNWLFRAPTSGGTPLRNAFNRAGELFEDDDSYFNEDFNTNLSCQQNFHIAISDGGWNGAWGGGTVLLDENGNGLPGDDMGLYTNYTGNGEQEIYSKTEGRTSLSDIAFDAWARDLNPNLNNNVKRFKKDYRKSDGTLIDMTPFDDEWESPEFVWNPKNDPAYWQHLVTYNVGMGLEATRVQAYEAGDFDGDNCSEQPTITDAKEAVYLGLRTGDCGWPDASNENRRIDDVWHSSINSRGQFFSANNPNELVNALNNVVNNILERVSRGASSTISSGVITDNTRAYSPAFDSSTWSGNLIAREINDDRTFGDPVWDASCILTGGNCEATGETVPKQTNRNIYTYNPLSKTKERFDTSLSTALKSIIELNAEELITNLSVTTNDIINYVIGDQGLEQANSGVLKDRVSVLADIVHASPYIVRGPSAGYEDSLWAEGTDERDAADADNGYLEFQIAQKDRNNTVYVGSNGGMLHAFNAEGADEGKERWGFMPSKALNNIHRLPDPTADHWSYVDNTPVVRDAFINGSWRSVLVSGMRYGGQSFFALDVTDGDSTEPTVLWEFSDTDDADMGFSYGEATIIRISSTGEWVALLPNGYNNSEQDFELLADPRNRISTSGNAVLYVVRLSDGQLLTKIDTGVGSVGTPNGLGSIVAVDSEFQVPPGESNPRVDYGADYGYAGDLYGNLWRFDFSDTNYANWSATKLINANGTKERPITVKPRVIAVPDGIQSAENDVIVMYATGKYLEPSDRSITLPADQYVVGVIDGLASTEISQNIETGDFVEQNLTLAGGGFLRDITANEVNHAVDSGWKVKLIENGERVFNPLSLIGREALFVTSNITAGTDPCEAGGRSWLMALNPLTGGIPNVGEIFENPEVIIDGVPQSIFDDGVGTFISDFVISSPTFTESPGGGTLDINTEGVNQVITTSIQKFTWRRRNWTNLLTE
ncbi:PilC/PilY family type IV pilus protein [Marinicella sp. S1101]|uniref:pilus assembly protein n=1 Tax=Marinicella marina TaxID=2996016 RepID=UPI002260837D|nr:PilC/PilY family type IV pilus protein [Marinicella marina]MCX7554646.1 PilC/PilY family type IV pilus protein [Marinicella marina]MDJ1140711.1 PilC/PilY family type IV pilus protein [Marinicella marina]